MDYVENLLQSIDQVVYHRLRDQKFDETIICTVTDTSKASRGLYVVSDGTIKFDAYSEVTNYKVDEAVRVNIPKGDYSQKKYIIGRSVSEKNGNQPIVYNSPSAEILDISGNLCTNTKAKIIANGGIKEVLIWSNERLSEDYANSIYDSILISAQFQTFFSPYNISKGTYGLRLKVIIAPKKASDKIICREYDLDSRDMFGDPYNYLLPSLQEAKFNFDVNENIQQMSLYLYQNDDFIYKNDTGTEQRLGMALAENIHVSNVHIGLGTNLSTIEDSTVKIYTDDDLTYNSINGTNQKAIKLIWYNKDDKNRYVGFSDGVVDASYDEMDYDKDMSNHNRLMVQASQGNIPDDYAGFELGARMSEIGIINSSLKKLIDRDLYSNIKKFKNALAPTGNTDITTGFEIIIDYIENQNEGQAILVQLDNLYKFYVDDLKFAAAASQEKLLYSVDENCYYIIVDESENKREKINMTLGLRDKEKLLFGQALDKDSSSGKWPWWKEVDKENGSLGKLINTVEQQLSSIKANVVSKAANYLSTYNNWQTIINNILIQIEKYTLDLQKLSMGQAYPMYHLNHEVPQETKPETYYSSSALFESVWKKDGETIWINGEGLLNRIVKSEDIDDEGFQSCTLKQSQYIKTDKTDNNGDDIDDNANKYQIYWYYERNGYTPGEEENPYGGPGWCEIGDNGSISGIGRFTILNVESQDDKEVIAKNIGLPKPIEVETNKYQYPTKPDENDQNGYLSISFSSNRPDIKEEKIKCVVIYNHQKYESNILTFKNEDPAAGPELTNAIQLVHGKNSRDIYACYNADNTLTNASDKVTPRELKIEYLNERGEPETGENSTLIGSTVYWYVPTGVTMLTVDNGDLGIGDDSVEDFECGSAVDRIYQILKSVQSVKCNGDAMIYFNNHWGRKGDMGSNHKNPWLVFNNTGTQVTFYIQSESEETQVTQDISTLVFNYNDDMYEIEFNSESYGLQHITNRALQNENEYIYQGTSYSSDNKPPHCTLVEISNNIAILTFQYAIEDLVYGGITYQFSDDKKQIISSNGQKYVIRNNQVILPVDEPDQYDREGFAYYYKTINSIDDLTFKYRIKEHYSQSFVNNTILCKVVKNNRVLEDSKIFTFSSQGVNGTNYSLVIDAEDGAHIFWNDDYKFSLSLFDYDGNQIPFMNPPTITCTNQSSIALSPKSSNENGVLSYKGTVHAMEQGSGVMTVKVTQPWPIDSNDIVNLEKIQPIAYTASLSYIAEVPTEIIYDSSGSNPTYYKEPLSLYEKMPNGDLKLVEGGGWKIDIEIEDEKKYFPVLQGQKLKQDNEIKYKNGLTTLKPLNMYITNNDKPCFLSYHSNNGILWQQPIIITQNRFPSTLLNNWDGSLQIKTDDGIILSNLVGAGRKNDDNEFSGVLIGDIDKSDIDNTDGGVFFNPHTGMGLYGFHNGAQSFGFNVDGTAFIGKAGGGRIAFDGNQGFIYSTNWLNSFQTEDGRINTSKAFPFIGDGSHLRTIGKGKAGMAIDLTSGHIDAYDFKLSSQGIQLNASPKDNESYFIIGDDTDNSKSCLKYDKDGKLTLRVNEMELIGITENPNLLNNTGPWFYDSEYALTHWSGATLQTIGDKDCILLKNPSIKQYNQYQFFKPGSYILTCEVGNIGPSSSFNLWITLGGYITKSQQFYLESDKFYKLEMSFTLSQEIPNEIEIGSNATGPDLCLYHLKLEQGNQATPWTASENDVKLKEQTDVFNQLTNRGKSKGIYLGDYDSNGNRDLYISADYISTGTLVIKNTYEETIFSASVDEAQVTIGGWLVGRDSLSSDGVKLYSTSYYDDEIQGAPVLTIEDSKDKLIFSVDRDGNVLGRYINFDYGNVGGWDLSPATLMNSWGTPPCLSSTYYREEDEQYFQVKITPIGVECTINSEVWRASWEQILSKT